MTGSGNWRNRPACRRRRYGCLLALTRFQDTGLLNETLERALSSRVRSQDTITVVGGVAANIRGREPAWEFVKSNLGGIRPALRLRRLRADAPGFYLQQLQHRRKDGRRGAVLHRPSYPRRRAHDPPSPGADAHQHQLVGAEPPRPQRLGSEHKKRGMAFVDALQALNRPKATPGRKGLRSHRARRGREIHRTDVQLPTST